MKINVIDKHRKTLSPTNDYIAEILIKRKKAINIDDRTIMLLQDRKDWIKLKTNIIKKENRVCYLCLKTISKNDIATVDHLIPRSKYGPDNEQNLHCCCKRCNEDKKNRTIKEYYNYVKMHKNLYSYLDLENMKKYL